MWMSPPWELEVWQLLLSAALVLLAYRTYDRKYGKYSNLPPCVPGWPVFGNTFQFRGFPYLHLDLAELSKTYGDIFTITYFGQRLIWINSGELLSNMVDSDVFPSITVADYGMRRLSYDCDDVGYRESGLTHRQLRTTVMSALSDCESQQALLEEEALKLVNILLASEEKSVCVSHEIKKSIGNVLTVSLLGKQYNDEEMEKMLELGEMIDLVSTPGFGAELNYIPVLRWLPFKSMKHLQATEKLRSEYVDQEFEKAKARFDPENVHCIVHKVLELVQRKGATMPSLTDRTAKGVMVDMYQAGWSTTSSVLNGLVIVLLNKPEVQRQIQKEVDSVIGSGKVPTLKDREEMPYIQGFIAEGLRLFSVVTSSGTRTSHNDVHYRGYFIPKDTAVLYNYWAANHDPEVFEEPWSFRPDRYLDEVGQILPPGHLIWKRSVPFGVGRRNCLGQAFARDRLFIYIAILMQRVTFLPLEGAQLPSYDPRTFEHALVVNPPPFQARVTPRD